MEWFSAEGYEFARQVLQRGIAAVYLVAFLNAATPPSEETWPSCALNLRSGTSAPTGYWDALHPSLRHSVCPYQARPPNVRCRLSGRHRSGLVLRIRPARFGPVKGSGQRFRRTHQRVCG
ncbi:hypothetical protein GD627_07190 [Arthrobacter yangruifuii]|uniref:Uncharacterized protein n=1 Tax=Arthrobacter yangruifuii TaxID=2606616 RepID=A0A5N6MQ55_9MICC|nr:hypothetical protein GD627_07190 [Arthrobacter yangruifuii]